MSWIGLPSGPELGCHVGWVEESASTAKGRSNVGRGGSKRTEPITWAYVLSVSTNCSSCLPLIPFFPYLIPSKSSYIVTGIEQMILVLLLSILVWISRSLTTWPSFCFSFWKAWPSRGRNGLNPWMCNRNKTVQIQIQVRMSIWFFKTSGLKPFWFGQIQPNRWDKTSKLLQIVGWDQPKHDTDPGLNYVIYMQARACAHRVTSYVNEYARDIYVYRVFLHHPSTRNLELGVEL